MNQGNFSKLVQFGTKFTRQMLTYLKYAAL